MIPTAMQTIKHVLFHKVTSTGNIFWSLKFKKSSSVGSDLNLFAVDTKIFNLVKRNCLIFWHRLVRRLITLRVCPKRSNVNLPGWDRPRWINNNRQKWFLVLLVQHLCWDINSWKPASIPRVRVVPSNHILKPTSLINKSQQQQHGKFQMVAKGIRNRNRVHGQDSHDPQNN